MARPREFDEIEALSSAMNVFRSKGYEAASLMDLLKAMELSKSSLYNSFGTKHELFIASIDHYIANHVRELEDIAAKATSVKQGIRDVFSKVLDMSTDGEDRRGCFLCLAASEVLPYDKIAEARINVGLNRIQKAFEAILADGKQRGEISQDKNIEKLAEFLLMSVMGIQAMGRATADRSRMNSVLENVEQAVAA